MSIQTPQEYEMAKLIVAALELEDVEVAEIDPQAPLFSSADGGLGLDSIDALEIVLAILHQCGVELRADDEQNEKIFASLRNLAGYVEAHRTSR